MNDIKKKFSLSVRVDSVTPAHVRLSIFSGMILEEYDHDQATRGKAGDLTLRVEEFGPFLDHVKPHIVSFGPLAPVELVEELTDMVFQELVD
jgi:hypothetical protein